MSERSGHQLWDSFGGRAPTSHERMTGMAWDASYQEGPAPWDIGQPQPAIARLAAEGAFTGEVLDVGCGTGDNALHLAERGLAVFGVDVAATAIALAREKATARGLDTGFAVADAFELGRLGRTFDTVLDSGMFHTCDSDEQLRYVASLATVTRPGATLYVLCFGDSGPESEQGPHPVTREEINTAFGAENGWHVTAVIPETVHANFTSDGAPGWLATITRA